jgi:hypothetical protein
MPGANLYDVLNYLSKISGISLIVDPYAFDEPFGSRRDPLDPEDPEPEPDEPGYRSGNVFDPQIGGTGTVMGNFENVPFDTALNLILGVHELEYVVYGGDTPRSGSYGTDSDPYSKPIILVTSRERLEQEIAGANTISMYQMHYADPDQMTALLNNFSLLPGTNSGWYIYRGGGSGGGLGGGGGNSGGGGSGGVGGGGGGGGGRGNQSWTPSIFAHRGSERAPVLSEVRRAIDDGENVIRILLDGDRQGHLTTVFAH